MFITSFVCFNFGFQSLSKSGQYPKFISPYHLIDNFEKAKWALEKENQMLRIQLSCYWQIDRDSALIKIFRLTNVCSKIHKSKCRTLFIVYV
jgi:hypothetical protein